MATHKGMHGGGTNKKAKGRTSITDKGTRGGRTKDPVPQLLQREASRPQSAGVKKRGDRRDMSRTYTNNAKHSARGSTPRKNVSTRAR
jgi:hypothetical protein